MPLSIRLPPTGLDFSHTRHFFEELAKDPSVVLADGVVDVSFGAGPCTRRAILYRADPHSLALEMGGDIGPLLCDEVDLCTVAAGPASAEYIRAKNGWAKDIIVGNPTPQIPVLDTVDVICPPMRDPYDRILSPRLAHAKVLRTPFSVPSAIFYTVPGNPRPLDVFVNGACGGFYPLRMIMWAGLQRAAQEGSLKCMLRPYLTPQDRDVLQDVTRFDAHQMEYADCLRSAKVFPFSPGVCGYPVQKYFEAMACGCLVIAPIPRDATLLGFVDGETMVACDHTDYMDKIRYYVANDAERIRITENAHTLVQRNYTCEAAARILVRKLTQIRDGATVESVDGGHE